MEGETKIGVRGSKKIGKVFVKGEKDRLGQEPKTIMGNWFGLL